MSLITETTAPVEEHGFSVSHGADWSKYMAFRPLYPPSFFKHIYDYHQLKPLSTWSTAHDVGAGAGIVSATLVNRFNNVIVSDPNDGYTSQARRILVEESGIPESKLTFLQEGAEKSSVESGTVDLIAACEMIQWTDTELAVEEFGRQLKAGGTLAVTSYTKPRIVGNDVAQGAWKKIFAAYSEKTQGLGNLYDRAFRIMNTGLENVGFPASNWESVKRIYVNSNGTLEAFRIDDRLSESRVQKGEQTVWEEGDQDWSDVKGIDWFKAYFATWVPKIAEEEIRGLWQDLEHALKGKEVTIETPIVIILATKKA